MVRTPGGGSSPGLWPLQGLQAQGRSRARGLRLGKKQNPTVAGPSGPQPALAPRVVDVAFPASRQDEGWKSDTTDFKK